MDQWNQSSVLSRGTTGINHQHCLKGSLESIISNVCGYHWYLSSALSKWNESSAMSVVTTGINHQHCLKGMNHHQCLWVSLVLIFSIVWRDHGNNHQHCHLEESLETILSTVWRDLWDVINHQHCLEKPPLTLNSKQNTTVEQIMEYKAGIGFALNKKILGVLLKFGVVSKKLFMIRLRVKFKNIRINSYYALTKEED